MIRKEWGLYGKGKYFNTRYSIKKIWLWGRLKKIDTYTLGDAITYDFEQVSFVNPEMLMMLVTSSKLAYDRTHSPVLWISLRPDVFSYLERLDVGNLDFVSLKKPDPYGV